MSHKTATTACRATFFSPIFWQLFGAWPENIVLMELEADTTLGHNLNCQNIKEKKIPHQELNFTMPDMLNHMNKLSLNGLILPVLTLILI